MNQNKDDYFKLNFSYLTTSVLIGPIIGGLIIMGISAVLSIIFGNEDFLVLILGFGGAAFLIGYPLCLVLSWAQIRQSEKRSLNVYKRGKYLGIALGFFLGLPAVLLNPFLWPLSIFYGLGFAVGIGSLYDYFKQKQIAHDTSYN